MNVNKRKCNKWQPAQLKGMEHDLRKKLRNYQNDLALNGFTKNCGF